MIVLIKNSIILNKFNTDDIAKAKSICEKNNIDYADCIFQNIEVLDYRKILDGITRIEQIQNNDVISINEALNKKLLSLKDNEIIFNDRIICLPSTHKIVNNEIIEKTLEEKLEDNVISSEEYNNIRDSERQQSYKNETDNLLLELMSSYLEARKDVMTETELKLWETLEAKKNEIKLKYPKEL